MTYRFKPIQPNLPLIDAEREILLRVSAEQCKAGIADDPQGCALALAAKAELRGLRQVQVLTNVSYFEFKDHIERFRNARPTVAQIQNFDRTKKFAPGDYRFTAMNPAWTRDGKKATNERNGRKSTGQQPSAGTRMEQTAIIRPRGTLTAKSRVAAK